MAWTVAPPLVKGLAVVVFVAVSAAVAAVDYKPANPQWLLLAVVAFGCGGIVAAFVLGIGEFLSRPWILSDIRHLFSREAYTRQTVPMLLLLGIFGAVFVMFAVHLLEAMKHGSTLSAWTAAVFAAIMFYPLIRYRIERGRWPD